MLSHELQSLVRSGNFAILSGEHITRNGQPYTLAMALHDGWYDTIPSVGTWEGEKEHSFLVPHCHAPAALHYGRMFSQECVIADNALWYTNGSIVPLDCGAAWFSDEPLNCDYTSVLCDDGEVYFHIPPLVGATIADRLAIYKSRMTAITPNVPR